MKTIDSLGDLRGRRVLVRSDFNVPLDGTTITDDGRIRAALPTLKRLADAGAKVVVMAHLGRPKGEVNPEFSLAPVAMRLAELIGQDVTLADDTLGAGAKAAVEAMSDGQVVLLENVRFDARETSKDDAERAAMATDLAELADAFVSDGIAQVLPAAAGELVIGEVEALSKATDDPERPYVVVLGGSKVSDKLGVIANLLSKADTLLIGGGMAFTFLKAQGHEVGKSLLEEDQLDTVRGYLEEASTRGVKILVPTDVVVAPAFAADAEPTMVGAAEIPADQLGLDIGPETTKAYAAEIAAARTVVWNGPMGVFEFDAFAAGTRGVAQALSDSEAFTIVGGGDSAAAVRILGFEESTFSHISTGGGASLELLEGKVLPGLSVLEDNA
jgi:phosphoglycerate kinase